MYSFWKSGVGRDISHKWAGISPLPGVFLYGLDCGVLYHLDYRSECFFVQALVQIEIFTMLAEFQYQPVGQRCLTTSVGYVYPSFLY